MSDMNSFSFTGRLTRDAEQKTLPTGTNLVTFDAANNTGFGQYAKTMYVTCNVWGKQGTAILPYLKKGKAVAISGTLEVQKWTSNADGMERMKLVVSCRDTILLAGGDRESSAPSAFKKDSYAGDDPAEYEDITY
jgi:single-strand DNA-binding protein